MLTNSWQYVSQHQGSSKPKSFFIGGTMKTAILVDGGFYRKRAQIYLGEKQPVERANELHEYCLRHLKNKYKENSLYRIFYYDCPPMSKKVYHPLLKRTIDFSKTELFSWSNEFLSALTYKRKVALRLGKLSTEQACHTLKSEVVKQLFNGKRKLSEISPNDFMIDVTQKGVDMKIGVDIASLAYKKQVKQIVLIAGDSDFVPAAKLARREGIDFILDNLGAKIKPELNEHIDGLYVKK